MTWLLLARGRVVRSDSRGMASGRCDNAWGRNGARSLKVQKIVDERGAVVVHIRCSAGKEKGVLRCDVSLSVAQIGRSPEEPQAEGKE